MTVQDVADKFGVSTASVRRWIRLGRLGALRLGPEPGASLRVTEGALVAFLTQRTIEGDDAA